MNNNNYLLEQGSSQHTEAAQGAGRCTPGIVELTLGFY